MQTIFFYCLVATLDCKKWWTSVLGMECTGISNSILRQLPTFAVTLNEQVVQWVHKLKYTGCYFNQSCTMDYTISAQTLSARK